MLDRRQLLLGLAATTACMHEPPPVVRGRVGELRGLTIPWRGAQREALLWIPQAAPLGEPAPLVLGLHDTGSNAAQVLEGHGWGRTCRQQGWFGLFPTTPDALDPYAEQDEPAFLVHLLDTVADMLPVDEARTYAFGYAEGGKRAYALAARSRGRLAAVAGVATRIGEGYTDALPEWSPRTHRAAPLSVLHIHGARDARVPLEGGVDGGRVAVPMLDGLKVWADWLEAKAVYEPTMPVTAPSRVIGRRWRATPGYEVLGLIDPKLGHEWPSWANDTIVAFFREAPVPRSAGA